MDLTKLLQAFEEFIFEVACLAILIPKTFFLLAFSPRRVYRYVTAELEKPKEQRFDGFASPLIFWIVTGVLPHFMVLSIFASLPAMRKLVPPGFWVAQFLKLSVQNRFAALAAFAISLPLGFAIAIVRARGQETSRTSLREPIYAQCYCLSPLLAMVVPAWFLLEAQARGVHPDIVRFAEPYYYALAIWLVYVELRLFREHLSIGWGRSLVLLMKSYWIFLFVMLILESSVLILVALSNFPAG